MPSKPLKVCGHEVMHVCVRVGRAAEKLEDAAFELIRVATVVEATSQPMPKRDPLRSYMDKIYAQVRSGPSSCILLLSWMFSGYA